MASSELVLGIDLGTTYSTAAAVIDGKLYYALDARGEACIPSVVHFPKSGPPLVGAEADRHRASDPQNTVFGVKRLIGRAADSPAARLLDACSAVRIKGQPGSEASLVVRAGELAASEVAAILLRHLKERAEARFGKRVGKTVLTVPVTATPEVLEAMQRCGKMAGLEVLRIVTEPAAGALARGADPASLKAPLLVYDFGGGTFDATVVRGEGGRLAAIASAGDDCLGGDDLDLAFARWVASGIFRAHGLDITKDAVAWSRIQRQCELVKRALSSAPEARYVLRDVLSMGGKPQHLDVPVRREHLAPLWQELVDRSLATAKEAVGSAGVGPADLCGVLLIGGTTYVPQVRAAVAAAFPRPCVIEDDPQTAVARGAAVLGVRGALLAA
ncbi:MAG TPA: Hsp70 family protein [Anaeromyxobacter sp.]|nr:Hsp70 family protein [Anaeromyxobacter sp.]